MGEFYLYADSFHNAAKTLGDNWKLKDDFDSYVIVFLYRHAVELLLKGSLLEQLRSRLRSPEYVDPERFSEYIRRLETQLERL